LEIKEKLNQQIFSTLEALSQAYNLGSKILYKETLIALNLDLAEYCQMVHEIHEVDKKLPHLYSKMWEMR
jgi:hypothetical protein